ncbi:MAG: alpha/beta hydrolase [Alphaproteobacteria bacterium]|nr:alpha/beta hydrolase [Alphaproteobacteria bacterium]
MILLLHGLPVDGRIWAPLQQRLAARGIASRAPDLPPGGDVASHRQWLAGIVEDLDPASLVVVGHDYGGLLAADLAARRGAAGLVLGGTTLGAGWRPVRWTALPGVHHLFYGLFAGRLWRDQGVPKPQRAAFRRAFPLDEPGLGRRMRTIARTLPTAAPALRGVPTLCLWGEEDRGWPRRRGEALASTLAAQWRTVPGRHYAMWSHPDAWAEALVGWRESLPGSAD